MRHDISHATGEKPPEIYIDESCVFVRGNYTESVITDEVTGEQAKSWTYEEDILTMPEYHHAINRDFSFVETWDDGLRTFQRSMLYDNADKMVMKYMTDVSNDDMKMKWIAYKASVRATQYAAGYPAVATLPELPE